MMDDALWANVAVSYSLPCASSKHISPTHFIHYDFQMDARIFACQQLGSSSHSSPFVALEKKNF